MEQSEEVLEPAPDHTGGDVMGAIEEVQLAQVRVCLYSLLLLLPLLPSYFYVRMAAGGCIALPSY
jgi:hypothetical protein